MIVLSAETARMVEAELGNVVVPTIQSFASVPLEMQIAAVTNFQ